MKLKNLLFSKIPNVPSSKKIDDLILEGIGVVSIRRSVRARNLRLSIKSVNSINATIPYFMTFKEAKKWILSKADWIRFQILRLKNSKKVNCIFSSEEKTHAKKELTERLEVLAAEFNFSYERVSIRNQKTRWGSCTVHNNINLNMRLVRLEPHLRDYVILHELVHTRIKNHSAIFWRELGRYIKNPKSIDRQLKKYRIELP